MLRKLPGLCRWLATSRGAKMKGALNEKNIYDFIDPAFSRLHEREQ